MASRLRHLVRRVLLVAAIAAVLTLIIIIWRRAPATTTVIAALIGAFALVFKDTLSNLIAGIMLFWLGTFRVGDVIRLDPSIAKSTPEPYVIVADITLLHVSFQQMVDHLAKIESQTMELGAANREHLTRVANQLFGLNVSL